MSLHVDLMIVGAGIAGLTAALSLAKQGIAVTLVEAFSRPSEVGAGIQMPPNACHVLAQLDVLADVKRRAIKPLAIQLGDAPSGKVLVSMPLDGQNDKYQPFLTIHRAALHDALYRAATAHDDIDILTGHRITRAQVNGDAVLLTAETADGTAQLTARTVIGADGVWSPCRRAVHGAANAAMTGRIALRAVVPANEVDITPPMITAWMAKNAHLVTYPVRNSATINMVAITQGTSTANNWNDVPSDATLLHLAQQFEPCGYRAAFMKTSWTAWPLATVSANAPWHNSHIVLVGDAAHATEPFAAQGAAMAIEDGYVLARHLAANPDNASKAFADYQNERIGRVTAMAKRTAFNRSVYHMGGLRRMVRNAVIRNRNPRAFLDDLDWLYGYRA